MKGWLMLLGLLVIGRVEAATSRPQVEVTPWGDGVWLHKSWQTVEPWGRVSSNGLIVREGDHLVVVDTAWGTEPSRVLWQWIDQEIGLPVSRLIVTHFHADRLAGWEVFAEHGARVVASARTLELAGVTPTDAFDLFRLKPGESITSGSVEILYPGPAHTMDNVVVWLPQTTLLVGGCAVRAAESDGLGNVADATISEWANSMRRVQQTYPDATRVVPGHGAPGGRELIQHTIDLAAAAALELPAQ
ncbi:subclass B1 metallo-beta-lactamase [Synoicihabitans lomoniglobus]|uniref:beta-lactamase n=1 Tax=Synoicihabitans lomoniglobus TaxID=2909285 RepID=A0AAE9ZZE8_9BACT|nr:subclass B1 metallo-beta-lactamase [Opitutaceae bacterium LMO-M01]WED63367.1 subclass B1 metallo-beta-lactamase [Opitutaceae bacterium LMO-M01]